MPKLRSATTTSGARMAGARALWRATGVKESDFGKPIIAVCNSFTQFVPGHVHLKDVGSIVGAAIEKSGGIAKEFNTIAVDDGIAMGHSGMLYSLPSRELIADSVEYMVNAHCADAMVCISNCDKITPGMLLAAMRLNIPCIFVSGGPMEAGKTKLHQKDIRLDLVDAMVAAVDPKKTDEEKQSIEESACPTCGSCSGMFTANSMNCLTEAIGLALPGNGSVLATHKNRRHLFEQAGEQIVSLCQNYYQRDDESVLPRNIANRRAFLNAMCVDIAMGGSTNTILHLLAAAQEGEIDFTLSDIDRLSRQIPHLCKVAPSTSNYYMEDVHRAGGIMAILGELERSNLVDTSVRTVHSESLSKALEQWDIVNSDEKVLKFYRSGPAGIPTQVGFQYDYYYDDVDSDRENGCIRNSENAYSSDGGLAVLTGNLSLDGCVVKTAGVDPNMLTFSGPARVFDCQDTAMHAILNDEIQAGDVIVIRYEGPKGGPGMQEMLYPTSYLKSKGLDKDCALVTDGRFSGGTSGLSIGHVSPEAASGGNIALVQDGDIIHIDIPARSINLEITDAELEERRQQKNASSETEDWQPESRERHISRALSLYAKHVSSADRGAVRGF